MPSTSGLKEINKKLDQVMDSVRESAKVAVQITAAQCVVYAKQSAPWQDRTGDARRSIHSEKGNQGMSATVGIGVSYGKYLETSFGGRYRVVDPTVFSYGKSVFRTNLRGIM